MAVIESQGSTFYWSTNAASTDCSTAAGGIVGQVVSYNGPTGSAAKIDVTHLASTAKEFIMGIRDEGELSFDAVYDPADVGQVVLFNDRASRTKRNWLITLQDASSNRIKGQGYCTGFAITGSVDDAMRATYTIAITGAVYISTGTTIGG